MRTPLCLLVAFTAVTLTLSACGQKGPLYLPQDPAAPAATGATAVQGQPAGTQQSKEQKPSQEQQTEQHTEAEAVTK